MTLKVLHPTTLKGGLGSVGRLGEGGMCKNGPRRDDDWAMEGWQSRGNGLAAVLAWQGWGEV